MQSYISHRRGTVFYHLINYLSLKTCPCKNIGNYRKYDIFFNFRFTGNMIFPSIAENQENMIFTLSGFTKMFFFIQCNRNYNTYRLLQICFYHPFVLFYKPKKRVWFAASWWSGNEKYFCFLFIASRALLQSHPEFNILL